ncbi:MAG: HEAT repeat domain-containing protein [Deltaproteobacteria bacterium]|nr:HEAT repeat domain-containing protein [Deltaproteobacteria bacterium]
MKAFSIGAIGIALLFGAPAQAVAWNFDWAGHVEADAENLKADDPQKRLDAVQALRNYDIALTEPHLLKALADDDDKVQQEAAKVLGAGGSTRAVPVMVDWLNDPDPNKRKIAAGALGDIGGNDAAQALTRSLGDSESAVRVQAVKALGAIGRRGNASVVIALIPRLEDDPWNKAEVKLATIAQLEELGDRRAVIPLVARFSDGSPPTRTAAVRAVGKLGDKSAVPALIRLIADPVEEVRTSAVGSLGALGAHEAIDALTEQLGTGGDLFRSKVAYALGQIAGTPGSGTAGENAMRTLVANLAQPTQRQAAREALRVAGKAAVPALVAHLQGRLAGDPTTAVTLLAEAADPRATATLAAELERGRVAMPIVLKALGATGDPAALVPVLRALSSKDAAIRIAAMESLRPLIGADARAGDVLVEHLTDADLEIRVLAAEYLGILRVASAAPRLAALAGPGNPARLRRAAIDALGDIGKREATPALVAVLKEGPAELHVAVANALSYIRDPSAIPMLIGLAKVDKGPTRHEVVRALGATMREQPDAAGRKALRELVADGSVKVGLAAIAGLVAAKDPADAAFLRDLAEKSAADRRRAAAWALGEVHDTASVELLASLLGAHDDRLIGDALWSIGEIVSSSPKDARLAAIADRLFLSRPDTRGAGTEGTGWASSINRAGAIARILWALPRDGAGGRNELLTGPRRKKLFDGAFHKSRLVRINTATALSSLAGDEEAAKVLAQLVRDDPSPHVRIAAARGLARVGGAKVVPALKAASDTDGDPSVREAAKAALAAAPPPPAARTEWRSYPVIDPGADDMPIRQEAYFLHTPDDIVWATYTDARGHITTEHAFPGDWDRNDRSRIQAAKHEAEY